jgi:formate hydrogenlyase subunit 3/multisubunit Na+/H+ antiporter MnhD subunit
VQANPKAVLAYSTVSQMGVTMAALGMGMALALPGTAEAVGYYATHHVLAKGALFLGVGLAGVLAGRQRRWLLLAPALVLALGFGGLPGTGGALAKAAVKPQLAEGLVGMLAALSATGSTLLMLHFMRRLAALAPATDGPAPPMPLLLPWLGLAAAAILLPWALFPLLGFGDPLAALTKDAAASLLPVLAGALLALALARWGGKLPAIPEGDVLHLTGPARRFGAALGAPVARAEAALTAWPAAGLSLLALVLALLWLMLRALPGAA